MYHANKRRVFSENAAISQFLDFIVDMFKWSVIHLCCCLLCLMADSVARLIAAHLI